MGKVTLYTRQNSEALKILEKEGVFRMKPEWIRRKYGDISDHYMKSYDWLIWASAKHVPKPAGVSYHVWCNISEDYMLRSIPGETVFKLSIDKEKIIYFDSGKWDLVLNQLYIPLNEEDEKAFNEELKKRGIPNQFVLFTRDVSRFHPDLIHRVRDSWERVFVIDDWNMFKVQANIWEFHPEDILEVQS